MLAKKPVASTALPVRWANPAGTLSPHRRHKRVSRQEAHARGEKLGRSDDELAFYEALETNDSAVQVLGDKTLRGIAGSPVNWSRRYAAMLPLTGRRGIGSEAIETFQIFSA